MPSASDLANRIRFDFRDTDVNGDPLGDWVEGFTVSTQVRWLRGGEAAMGQRLEGKQPAVLVVRTSSEARQISSAYRAVAISGRDVRPGQVFNITATSAAAEVGFIDVLGVVGGAAG